MVATHQIITFDLSKKVKIFTVQLVDTFFFFKKKLTLF